MDEELDFRNVVGINIRFLGRFAFFHPLLIHVYPLYIHGMDWPEDLRKVGFSNLQRLFDKVM